MKYLVGWVMYNVKPVSCRKTKLPYCWFPCDDIIIQN